MRVQLWSYNYAPEPTGIGPLSATLAHGLATRGHQVRVVAAHPHYPEPRWGARRRPYRQRIDGIEVLRLPLWPGRSSMLERLRQEASFTGALAASAPLVGGCDVMVVVSPSFPALVPAMVNARARRIPWVLWLQDILPDGATATGVLREGLLIEAARRLEKAAYCSAARIVAISDSFGENLRAKNVPPAKIERIYNPATEPISPAPRPAGGIDPRLVMTMGNIGLSQNLASVVQAFQASAELKRLGARFILAGDGVQGDTVREAIDTDRVSVTGVLGRDGLEGYLSKAAVAVVSQGYEGIDFNVPSKLMNFMARGLPVVASVREDSEVARIIRDAGAGWVTDSSHTVRCAAQIAEALANPAEARARGEAGQRFARRHFDPSLVGGQFEAVLGQAAGIGGR